MREKYDVVVIGSGFGGAITACRLAQAGRSVCLLERGRRWPKEKFPRTTGQVAKAFWDERRSYGLLEYKAFRRVSVVQSCGVGGGSLHYYNVHLRTPAEIFQSAAWPAEVSRPLLDPYYDLVKQMLEPAPLKPPAGRDLPPRTKAFFHAVEKTGRKAELVDIAVYTGPDRISVGGLPQTACVYCCNCLLGCHVHAKNSLDVNYIPVAEKKYGAEVYPLHAADKIVPADGGYTVHFRHFDESQPGRWEPGSVTGQRVVISAGSLGSTELLLRCREEHKTLPDLGRALGTRFSGNGDMAFAGTMGSDRDVDPAYGPPITAIADFSTGKHRIHIEDAGVPDALAWYLEGSMPSGHTFRNLFKVAKIYLCGALGISIPTTSVGAALGELLGGGRTSRLLPYLAMGTDAADGVMRLRNGSIDIDWSHRRSRDLFRETENAFRELTRALGGTYMPSGVWRWPLRKMLTGHPLGGCPMGTSRENSVVNHHGEVWDYPGLYVADAAVIPSALSVNPSMTISALAERTAFWMLHGRDLQNGDTLTPQNR